MANAVEMSTMRKLVAQLNQYRHEYYNLNAPSVADDVYDYMYDELLALEEHTGVCMANSPTQTVGYPVVSALPKVAHDIPLLSLDKTKSIEDLIAFQAGRTVDLSLKLDGLTTELIYENGQLIYVIDVPRMLCDGSVEIVVCKCKQLIQQGTLRCLHID